MASQDLNAVFAALSDPTRRAVLARLAKGEATVTELAKPFAMALPTFSRHLQVLERAGLIERGRDRQYRPCRIDAGPLKQASGWIEQFAPLWEDRFDRFDAMLTELQQTLRDGPA
ncbi:MAG TPA: metalloregulator ArsR/SmtB family transcription factor [Rhizobiaceae bacterium]|nr:metalloregulator ArsR/SmtB family transcription factor [Rhizobiaceae bacterium]